MGVILYELATLNPPFTGENPLAIARKIVEEEYVPLSVKDFSPLFVNLVKACMTVAAEERPDILYVCQMIGPLLIFQIDEFRRNEDKITKSNKKDAPVAVKMQVNPGSVKKISDPTQPLFQELHKIIYLTQLPPGIKKDPRRSIIESFKHWLFSDAKNADNLKFEIAKLQNCDKEEIPIIHKDRVTYETLNFAIEELLIEQGYYDKTGLVTAEMFFQQKHKENS